MDYARLLNPKAFVKSKGPASKKAEKKDEAPANSNGSYSQMIEQLHNVQDRDEAPMKKRKAQAIDDDHDDDEHKKSTANFNAGGSGIISEHLTEQRKKLAAEGAKDAIDLTQDDDVEIIKETAVINPTAATEKVCLGVLHGCANAYRIPAVNSKAVLKDWWPRAKAEIELPTGSNNIVMGLTRAGIKFANVDMRLARGLVPLLQARRVNNIEIKVWLAARPKIASEVAGAQTSQALKVEVFVDAPRDKADSIGRFLSQRQLFLTMPMVNTGRLVYNPQMPKPLGQKSGLQRPQTSSSSSTGTSTVGRTVEQILRETSSMFDSLTKEEEDIPEMEANNHLIKSPLMEHQKKALHWLLAHERTENDGDELPTHSLWRYRPQDNGRPSWYHLITDEVVFERPEHIQGGILADVMGLGKTLSILALIAETREAARIFRREENNAKSTLIICPKSVLSNWQEQIRNHTVDGKSKVYTYHGTSRTQDLHELAKYDIVLTSYNTAASELNNNSKNRALFGLKWFRIVLDEAHQIRNSTTNVFKACCALDAERRWAVTGTPVQNSLLDLGSLFRFLHLNPFDSSLIWNQYILAPFKNGDVKVIEQLQILVRSVTLRRTKNTIELPDKIVERVRLDFTKGESTLYKEFATKSRAQYMGLTGGGKTALRGKAYAHILKSIGRLRSICAHGREMLSKEDLEEIAGHDENNAIMLDIGDEIDVDDDGSFFTEKVAYDYLRAFCDGEADLCQNCGDKLVKKEDPNAEDEDEEVDDSDSDSDHDLLGHLTRCLHLICTKCTGGYDKEVQLQLTSDHYHTCPHCSAYVRHELYPLRQSVLDRLARERQAISRTKGAKWDPDSYSGPHTKVKALLQELEQSAAETEALPAGEPPIRSVVFSGWTQFLDLIEYALDNNSIGCVRIDGTMSVKQRSRALNTFNTDDNVRVLLVSIKAGGQGLNFTSANKAYVMEPGYNPAAEQQAVDRVHRIGQKRDVTIKHFIIRDSIEERILKLQQKKEALANMSMDRKKTKAGEAKQRIEDVMELFKTTGKIHT